MKREPLLLRRLADYLWGFKLTRFGQILVVFGLLAGLFLSLSVEILRFDLFIVMFAVGFLALLLNVCWRTRLETTLRLPDRVAAGTVVQGVARIRNAGRRPVYDVGASLIGLPPGLREAMPDIYIEARRAMLRTAVERGCRCRVFIVHAGDPAQHVDADEETSVTFLTPEQVWQGRLGVL